MIDGVTILNVIEQTGNRELDNFCTGSFCVAFLMCVIFLIAFTIKLSDFCLNSSVVSGLVAVSCTIIALINGYCPKTLQVTMTEEVSMVEFMEKYEIVSVDGSIYTVEERTESCD